MINNKKTHIDRNDEHWVCLCNNNTMGLGFFPCDNQGHYIEPTADSKWSGLYACQECGRIIEPKTKEIVGQNTSARTYDDFLEKQK